jgi:hypothetical protein
MMQDIQLNKDESFTPQLQVLSNFGQMLQIAPNTCQASRQALELITIIMKKKFKQLVLIYNHGYQK